MLSKVLACVAATDGYHASNVILDKAVAEMMGKTSVEEAKSVQEGARFTALSLVVRFKHELHGSEGHVE